MNRTRMLIGIGVAILISLLTSTFVYRQFKRASSAVHRPTPTTQVVVADKPMALGTRLSAQDLRLIPWAASAPMPGMFSRTEDCVNRALTTSVIANEPILEGKLAPKEGGVGLSAAIPEGMRAVSVAVNDVVDVAGFVLPGTMVDVLATAAIPGRANEPVTRAILENVRVLAAGQKIEQDREGKPQTVAVITLLVDPVQAGKLAMASTQGKIQLALRNTIDTKLVAPPAIYLSGLFGIAEEPKKVAGRPVRSAPPPYEVEVITGSKKETKGFPSQQGGQK